MRAHTQVPPSYICAQCRLKWVSGTLISFRQWFDFKGFTQIMSYFVIQSQQLIPCYPKQGELVQLSLEHW